ncbi:MAG: UbiA family prenyltransferase [Rhodocyclaceae bacterium]|nr:UbiA family prenyltransferase [Rhodocyclaceae bacterium]
MTAPDPPPSPGRIRWRALVHAARPHHWVKNLLVFLPLIAAHRWDAPAPWVRAALVFAAFCLCSSAAYLANDLADLHDDRAHPQKRLRPLASGAVRPPLAIAVALTLLAAALLLAGRIGALVPVAGYAAAALAYSLWVKPWPLVDLFWLVGLYLLRIIAGGAATGIIISDLLLVLAGMVFASLACVKRAAELGEVATGTLPAPQRRGYRVEDRALLIAAGLASAFAVPVVLLLYLREDAAAQLYPRPGWVLVAGVVLLSWLLRLWLLAGRGRLRLDPVVFALRDRISLVSLLALAGCVLAASL